jgi:uncharacterized protein (TIGR00288 family)
LAPWWLRSSKDETVDDDDDDNDDNDNDDNDNDDDDDGFSNLAGEEVLGLLGHEDDEDAWEPEATLEPSPDDDVQQPQAAEPSHPSDPLEGEDDAPVAKKRRKRKRKRRKPVEDEHAVLEHAASEHAASEHVRPAPEVALVAAPQPALQRPRKPARAVESLGNDEIVFGLPERSLLTASDERKIALFCDLENIALGVRNSPIKKFDINLVLERLLEKGKIIVKKAYADWERYSEFKRTFHEAAIELIDIPQRHYSGKNSADIKMVVDAMDMCFSKEHLDTFVLLSGDSDFSPLVSKLKENNKYVIGMGVKNSTSNLLIDNCDEFVYYEDVWRDLQRAPRLDHLSEKEAEVFGLLVESIFALVRENKTVLWGSMLKQTMQRKRPSFSEGYYSYSSFSDLLEDAQDKNIIQLKRDPRSGNYAVTGFGVEG